MNLIIERLKIIKTDKIQFYTMLIAVALCCCHAWQFYDSKFHVHALVRLILSFVYIVLVFFLGRKPIPIFLYSYSLVILLMEGYFLNYTPIWLAAIAIIMLPKKYTIPLVALHIVAVIVVAEMHDKTPVHIIIYCLNGLFLFGATKILAHEKIKKSLILKDDEKKILQELRAGKQQKEIDFFSQTTITQKLKDAKARNNIATTEELLMLYINDNIS